MRFICNLSLFFLWDRLVMKQQVGSLIPVEMNLPVLVRLLPSPPAGPVCMSEVFTPTCENKHLLFSPVKLLLCGSTIECLLVEKPV